MSARIEILRTPGLCTYWRCDQAASPLLDYEDGFPAPATGTVYFQQPGPFTDDPHRAVALDGATGFFTAAHSVGRTEFGDSLSMLVWVKRDPVVAPEAAILNKLNNGYQMRVAGNVLRLHKSNSGDVFATSAGIPNDGKFHMVVMTKGGTDPTKCAVYLDGVKLTGTFTDRNLASSGSASLEIGRFDSGAGYFKGTLSDIALFDRPITDADVARIWNAVDKPDLLPPEEPHVELEQVFISESPSNLWPENQDSYFGVLRRTLVEPLQIVADQLDELFSEIFWDTTDAYLGRHEKDQGIPKEPTGITTEQRRDRLLMRLRKGAFTRTNRILIVETFLRATQSLGIPTAIFPEGLELLPAGLTLYNEPVPADLTPYYAITENVTNFSYNVNISPVLTPDIEALTRELRHFTPAGISFTITQTSMGTLLYPSETLYPGPTVYPRG